MHGIMTDDSVSPSIIGRRRMNDISDIELSSPGRYGIRQKDDKVSRERDDCLNEYFSKTIGD